MVWPVHDHFMSVSWATPTAGSYSVPLNPITLRKALCLHSTDPHPEWKSQEDINTAWIHIDHLFNSSKQISLLFSHPLQIGEWKHHKKALIMQYALMHKWLERLTHTNIHISRAEKIPQGLDRAICVRPTEHKENTRTHTHKPRGWQHLGEVSLDWSHVIISVPMWEVPHTLKFPPLLQVGGNVVCTQGTGKCYLAGLDCAVTQHSHETSWRGDN